MMLNAKKKQQIINKFKIHDTDTGSPEVQIAILSDEIKELTKHLQAHKHDFSSRRGLLKKLGERRRLLRYLEAESVERFNKLTKTLGLKIKPRQAAEEEEEALFSEELPAAPEQVEGETTKNQTEE
ncbi:30S ribosomal protein S15 [Candidatus Falkowbacteria bacterium]|nr:30S ribosomal protein S15 [Candidatus Falkowbacteria bacterium]